VSKLQWLGKVTYPLRPRTLLNPAAVMAEQLGLRSEEEFI